MIILSTIAIIWLVCQVFRFAFWLLGGLFKLIGWTVGGVFKVIFGIFGAFVAICLVIALAAVLSPALIFAFAFVGAIIAGLLHAGNAA